MSLIMKKFVDYVVGLELDFEEEPYSFNLDCFLNIDFFSKQQILNIWLLPQESFQTWDSVQILVLFISMFLAAGYLWHFYLIWKQ